MSMPTRVGSALISAIYFLKVSNWSSFSIDPSGNAGIKISKDLKSCTLFKITDPYYLQATGSTECLKLLAENIRSKEDLNLQNNFGIAPIHIALMNGDKATMEILLRFGADTKILVNMRFSVDKKKIQIESLQFPSFIFCRNALHQRQFRWQLRAMFLRKKPSWKAKTVFSFIDHNFNATELSIVNQSALSLFFDINKWIWFEKHDYLSNNFEALLLTKSPEASPKSCDPI